MAVERGNGSSVRNAPGVGMYITQPIYTITNLDVEAFTKAWQHLIDRYPILRTSVVWDGVESPVQRVHSDVKAELQMSDWTDISSRGEREARFKQFLREDPVTAEQIETTVREKLVEAGAMMPVASQ